MTTTSSSSSSAISVIDLTGSVVASKKTALQAEAVQAERVARAIARAVASGSVIRASVGGSSAAELCDLVTDRLLRLVNRDDVLGSALVAFQRETPFEPATRRYEISMTQSAWHETNQKEKSNAEAVIDVLIEAVNVFVVHLKRAYGAGAIVETSGVHIRMRKAELLEETDSVMCSYELSMEYTVDDHTLDPWISTLYAELDRPRDAAEGETVCFLCNEPNDERMYPRSVCGHGTLFHMRCRYDVGVMRCSSGCPVCGMKSARVRVVTGTWPALNTFSY